MFLSVLLPFSHLAFYYTASSDLSHRKMKKANHVLPNYAAHLENVSEPLARTEAVANRQIGVAESVTNHAEKEVAAKEQATKDAELRAKELAKKKDAAKKEKEKRKEK